MARAMAALRVAKVVVKGTEPEARLLYRLLAMLGGQTVPLIEAWPLLRVEPMSYLRPEVWKVATRGDELVPGALRCSSGEAVVEEE